MADTYTLISSVTVGAGGASSIDFTSIPATYTDLKLVLSLRSNRTSPNEAYVQVRFNGATTGWTARRLEGSGSSAYSSNEANNWVFIIEGAGQTASTFANTEVYIPNYAGSNNKSFSIDSVEENNATTAYQQLTAGLWSNTSAINQITVVINADNSASFVQYSTAYLYGISNS